MDYYSKLEPVIEGVLWEGESDADAAAFCTEHGLPQFVIGTKHRRTGLCVYQTDTCCRVAISGEDVVYKVDGKIRVLHKIAFNKAYSIKQLVLT
jgi:hypothetical protein